MGVGGVGGGSGVEWVGLTCKRARADYSVLPSHKYYYFGNEESQWDRNSGTQ